MTQNNNSQNSGNFYESLIDEQPIRNNKILIGNIETILPTNQNSYHYLCPKCQKFPLIEFKERKNIKKTCLCINNQKITITDFLDNIESNIIKGNFLSSTANDIKNNNYNYRKTNKDLLSEKDELNNGFMCINVYKT